MAGLANFPPMQSVPVELPTSLEQNDSDALNLIRERLESEGKVLRHAQLAYELMCQYLLGKYQLSPRDEVLPSGRIHRKGEEGAVAQDETIVLGKE
jgi:hypothetical protein